MVSALWSEDDGSERMKKREEQCHKVCRILDDVLANRPHERDALCEAVDKAFEALIQSEQWRTGKWIKMTNTLYKCDQCGAVQLKGNYCKDCGAKMTKGDAE